MKLVSESDLNHRFCFDWLSIWTSAMFGADYRDRIRDDYTLDAAAELMAEGKCIMFRTDGLGQVIEHKALEIPEPI